MTQLTYATPISIALRWKFYKAITTDPKKPAFMAVVTDEAFPRTLFYSYDGWSEAPMRHAVQLHNDLLIDIQNACKAIPPGKQHDPQTHKTQPKV